MTRITKKLRSFNRRLIRILRRFFLAFFAFFRRYRFGFLIKCLIIILIIVLISWKNLCLLLARSSKGTFRLLFFFWVFGKPLRCPVIVIIIIHLIIISIVIIIIVVIVIIGRRRLRAWCSLTSPACFLL